MVSNLVGGALSLLSGAFKRDPASSSSSGAPGANNRRPSGHGTVPQSPRATRGAPGGPALGNKGPFWATFTRRFALNGLLWVLAITTLVASCFFYREHLRYADANQIDRDSATLEVAASADSVAGGEASAATTDSGVGGLSLAGLGLTGSGSASAPPVGPVKDSSAVTALKAEVTTLRELVERHDKMLRYVMDRYVEKSVADGSNPASGALSSAAHEASMVNFAEPEFLSKSDYDGAAAPPVKAGDSHRKRSRSEGAMGGPEMESGGVGEPVAEKARAEPEHQKALSQGAVATVAAEQAEAVARGESQALPLKASTAEREREKEKVGNIQKENLNLGNLGI